jgi:four helix bundle protein
VQTRNIHDRTFLFACRIAELSEKLQRVDGVARFAAPQLFRSGTSIGANLEEADAGQTKPDFIAKVCIALKEARETNYWLRLLVARRVLQSEGLEADVREAHEIVAILTAIVKGARASSSRGD